MIKINPKVYDYFIPPAMAKLGGRWKMIPAMIPIPDDVDRFEFVKAHYEAHFRNKRKQSEKFSMPKAKSKNREWKVKSSMGDKYYTVTFVQAIQDYTCTCPAFHYRKRCRHITEISNRYKNKF